MRTDNCSVCKLENIDEVEKLYVDVGKNVTRTRREAESRFGKVPEYHSFRRHFKVHFDHTRNTSREMGEESVTPDNGDDLTDDEIGTLKANIEASGMAMSADEIINSAQHNKKINLENARRLEALIPNIDALFEFAETDKMRLDCIKQKKDIVLAVNKLRTEYIQTNFKTREVLSKTKEEGDTVAEVDETFKESLILVANKLRRGEFEVKDISDMPEGDKVSY